MGIHRSGSRAGGPTRIGWSGLPGAIPGIGRRRWSPCTASWTLDGCRLVRPRTRYSERFSSPACGSRGRSLRPFSPEALRAVAGRGETGLSRAELHASLSRSLRRAATVDPRTAAEIVDGLLAGLVAGGRLARDGDRLYEPGGTPALAPAVIAAMDRLERALAVATPPALADALRASGCPPEGLRVLERAGRIVRLDDGLAYAGSIYGELARTALAMAAAGALTPALLRDATGTSRKYVMALLEDLDRRGNPSAHGRRHVPGPRAALADQLGRPAGS